LARKARQNAKARSGFRTKRLNQWVGAAEAFFDLDQWDACADPGLRELDFAGLACTVGLDLASKRDINAAVRRFEEPGESGLVTLLFDFWLPRARIDEADNPSYPGWAEDGHLHTTEGNVVDYTAIKDRICDLAVLHDLTELGFDPYQATHMVRLLMDENINCVEIRPTVLNFSEPMKELDKLIAEGRLRHDGNPVMRWMIGNVVAMRDHKDNVYPRKEKQENKIDGPVAAIMAEARAAAPEEIKPVPQIVVLKGRQDENAELAEQP
jgi:phage terminase large subunit-like protein